MTIDDDRDRCAHDLYTQHDRHLRGCNGVVSLADQLQFWCPHCRRPMLQCLGPNVAPELAVEMFAACAPAYVAARSPKQANMLGW